MLDRVTDFAALIAHDGEAGARQADHAIRASERTGRPLGNADFIGDLERILKRPIACRAPGRKPNTLAADQASLFT